MMNGSSNQNSPFAPTSRYYGIATAKFIDRHRAEHVYVLRRFIPPAQVFATLELHIVMQGERYDTLAANYIGDPLQFWRLADANGVSDPSDLETPGRSVRVTLPAGIPGHPGD
jgi:hypothetical protein